MNKRDDLEKRLAERLATLPSMDPEVVASFRDGGEVGAGFESLVHPTNAGASAAERRVAPAY